MSRKRYLAAGIAALGAAFGFPGAAQAQQEAEDVPKQEVLVPSEMLTGANVMLRVDGMVCPFCAYGLEKRLEEVPSIDAVLIRVSDGVVQIRTKKDMELTDQALQEAVKKSGFTLRKIERVDG